MNQLDWSMMQFLSYTKLLMRLATIFSYCMIPYWGNAFTFNSLLLLMLLFILWKDGNAPKITSSGENIIAISGEKQLQITIGDNLTTVIGTDIDILCPVVALPNPTITWLFNGSAIKEGNPRLVKVAKTVLNLAGVTPEDIGSYTCHANNTFGKDIKTTFLSLISEYLKLC